MFHFHCWRNRPSIGNIRWIISSSYVTLAPERMCIVHILRWHRLVCSRITGQPEAVPSCVKFCMKMERKGNIEYKRFYSRNVWNENMERVRCEFKFEKWACRFLTSVGYCLINPLRAALGLLFSKSLWPLTTSIGEMS